MKVAGTAIRSPVINSAPSPCCLSSAWERMGRHWWWFGIPCDTQKPKSIMSPCPFRCFWQVLWNVWPIWGYVWLFWGWWPLIFLGLVLWMVWELFIYVYLDAHWLIGIVFVLKDIRHKLLYPLGHRPIGPCTWIHRHAGTWCNLLHP